MILNTLVIVIIGVILVLLPPFLLNKILVFARLKDDLRKLLCNFFRYILLIAGVPTFILLWLFIISEKPSVKKKINDKYYAIQTRPSGADAVLTEHLWLYAKRRYWLDKEIGHIASGRYMELNVELVDHSKDRARLLVRDDTKLLIDTLVEITKPFELKIAD